MIYIFQWRGNNEGLEAKLKDRQGYGGFKLVELKNGSSEGIEITQATIEWNGDDNERPHPLFKEMTRCGGEIFAYKM